MRRLGLLVLLLWITMPTFAQDLNLLNKTLEPITAQNADRIVQVWGQGISYGGFPYWSPDSQIVYFDTIDGVREYRLEDVAHSNRLDKLPFPQPDFSQAIPDPVAISPDNRYVVQQEILADNERSALYHVIDTFTNAEVKSIAGDAVVMRNYSGILFIPQFFIDGLLFLRDNSLYRWQPMMDVETLVIERFVDISISPNGRYAVTYALLPTLNAETEFRIWDLANAPASLLYEHIFPAMDSWHSIAFSPDGHSIATGGSNENVRIWNFSTDNPTYIETNRPNEYGEQEIIDLAYSSDGRFLAGCVSSIALGSAFIMDATSGEVLATIQGEFGTGYSYFSGVAFNPSDQTVVFGTADGTIRTWSVDSVIGLKETTIDTADRIFSGHTKPVVGIAISPDGKQMATASWDNSIKLWDYTSGQMIQSMDTHTAPAWGVTFSPDGKLLATSAEDGTVQLWNLETHQHTILATIKGEPTKPLVTDLEFSTDGSILAGAEFNGQIHLWDMKLMVEVALINADETVWHLDFNETGTLLATASTVGTVKLWAIESGS